MFLHNKFEMLFKRINEKNIFTMLTRWSNSFAQKKKVSLQAQKAILATQIIQFIAGAKFHPSSINLQSCLADELSKIEIAQYDIEDKAKAEVFKLFTEGIKINEQIYSQSRISESRTLKEGKFVFFPNYAVTGIIFSKLMNPKTKMMITGAYGIGKTISIIFFLHLCNYIHQYGYYVNSSPDRANEYETLLKEAAILYPRKYWYWSIKSKIRQKQEQKASSEQENPLSLMDIIINQATQISEMDRLKLKQCQSIPKLRLKVKKMYHPDTEHVVIIDQINTAASYMRNWNYFLLENLPNLTWLQNKLRTDPSSINDPMVAEKMDLIKLDKKTNYSPAIQLKGKIEEYLKFTPQKFILNSSVNIELQNLLRIKYNELPFLPLNRLKEYKPLSLELCDWGRHDTIAIINVTNRQTQNKLILSYDFWRFFWFEISRQVRAWRSEEDKKKIKDMFMSNVLTLAYRKNYRYLYIRQFCQQNDQSFKNIKATQDTEQVAKYLFKDIASKFQSFCLTQNRERMKKFLDKGDRQIKLKLLRAYVTYAEDLLKNGFSNFDLSITSFKEILKTQITLDKYFLCSEHNKELIPAEYNNAESKVSLLWQPEEFLEIAKDFAYPKLAEKFMTSFMKYQMTASGTSRGITMQSFITYLMQPKAVFDFYVVKSAQTTTNTKKGMKWENLHIQISNKMGFTPFNEVKKDKYNIEKNLSPILTWCKNNPEKWNGGVPCPEIQTPQGDKKLDLLNYRSNSEVIDFLLAKYQKPSSINPAGKYIIYTFDATVSTAKIQQKVDDGIKFMMNLITPLKAANRTDFQISHIILGPYIKCKRYVRINGIGNIYFSSIDQLQIQNSKLSDDVKDFQQTRQFIIGIREGQSEAIKLANRMKRQKIHKNQIDDTDDGIEYREESEQTVVQTDLQEKTQKKMTAQTDFKDGERRK